MKYYYLNEDKKPQGPYSEHELVAFKQSGLINDDTLAAAAGDSKWVRLADLLDKTNAEECSTWNKELGSCPHCGKELEGSMVPEVCPHCQKNIHGHGKGLWYAFVYAIKNSFNYKGRATRTEFWGFYLFSYIISLALGQISGAFVSEQQAIMEQEMAALGEHGGSPAEVFKVIADFMTDPSVLASQGISIVVSLALFIPMLSLTSRRLHDTGRSMVSLIIGCVSYVAMVSTFMVMMSMLAANFETIISDDFVFEDSPLVPAFISMIVSWVVFTIVSVYLFVMMVLPSKPGSNKYGPSTLYPRG